MADWVVAHAGPKRSEGPLLCPLTHDGDVVVHGSMQLVEALLEHDLVDELRLMVFPVVLGSGNRLFGSTSDKKPLKLRDSQIVGDGVAILVYERA
jgi:dihydrofolate reductase